MTRVFLAMLMLVVMGITGSARLSHTTDAHDNLVAAHETQVDHPIVGAWRWDNNLAQPNTHISYGVFHADGTYFDVTAGAGIAVGVWQATGTRTAEVTAVFQDLSEDLSIVKPGAATIVLTAEVAPSGTVATAAYVFEVRTLDGAVLDQRGPAQARGTRVTVASMMTVERPICDAIGGLRCY